MFVGLSSIRILFITQLVFNCKFTLKLNVMIGFVEEDQMNKIKDMFTTSYIAIVFFLVNLFITTARKIT